MGGVGGIKDLSDARMVRQRAGITGVCRGARTDQAAEVDRCRSGPVADAGRNHRQTENANDASEARLHRTLPGSYHAILDTANWNPRRNSSECCLKIPILV